MLGAGCIPCDVTDLLCGSGQELVCTALNERLDAVTYVVELVDREAKLRPHPILDRPKDGECEFAGMMLVRVAADVHPLRGGLKRHAVPLVAGRSAGDVV